MSLLSVFEWLAHTRASVAMTESIWAFPIVESIHVLSLCLFLGMTTILDLRLLSLVMRDLPVSAVATLPTEGKERIAEPPEKVPQIDGDPFPTE